MIPFAYGNHWPWVWSQWSSVVLDWIRRYVCWIRCCTRIVYADCVCPYCNWSSLFNARCRCGSYQYCWWTISPMLHRRCYGWPTSKRCTGRMSLNLNDWHSGIGDHSWWKFRQRNHRRWSTMPFHLKQKMRISCDLRSISHAIVPSPVVHVQNVFRVKSVDHTTALCFSICAIYCLGNANSFRFVDFLSTPLFSCYRLRQSPTPVTHNPLLQWYGHVSTHQHQHQHLTNCTRVVKRIENGKIQGPPPSQKGEYAGRGVGKEDVGMGDRRDHIYVQNVDSQHDEQQPSERGDRTNHKTINQSNKQMRRLNRNKIPATTNQRTDQKAEPRELAQRKRKKNEESVLCTTSKTYMCI